MRPVRLTPRSAKRSWTLEPAPKLLPIFAEPIPQELFACLPLNARLSRSSCGARHLEARRKGEKGKVALITGTCARCQVGAAHAKGSKPAKWPDGLKVRNIEVVPKTGTVRVAPSA